MIDVLGEDRLDVASTEDQEVVQAVFSDGANPAFGKRVRPWGADRRLDGLDADRGEYSVERRGELGVPVADEEAETTTGIFESAGEVAGDLGHPEIVGVGGDAEEENHAAFDFDHEQDVAATQQHGVDREEVGRQHALRLGGGTRSRSDPRAEARGEGRCVVGRWRRCPSIPRCPPSSVLRRCAGSPSEGSPWTGGR